MCKLLNVLLFCILWLPNLKAQKKACDSSQTLKLYAKIFEGQIKNGVISLPKGIATKNSLLKYFSEAVKPSGFKDLDTLLNTSSWSYLKEVDFNQFNSTDRQIKLEELFIYLIKNPKAVKDEDYFCHFSPVIFSEDLNKASFVVEYSQRGVMIYFYEKKIKWELVKATTLLLF